MLAGELLAAEGHDACVEAAVEQVLHRVRREEVPLLCTETVAVQHRRDRTVRLAGGAGRERLPDRLVRLRVHDGSLAGFARHVAERDRTDRKPRLGPLTLRLHDVHGELVREELGESADRRQHQFPGRGGKVDVLCEADEPDARLAKPLERIRLHADVPRPTVDRVDHHGVERAAARISQERGELWALFEPIGVCAHPFVGVDAHEGQAVLIRVSLDLPPLSVEGAAVHLLIGRDADVTDDPSNCWLHRFRLLRMIARTTSAHSRIMCSSAARSSWSSLSRGFASGPAIADLPGLSESFPDPVGASAPPQAMKADRASLPRLTVRV